MSVCFKEKDIESNKENLRTEMLELLRTHEKCDSSSDDRESALTAIEKLLADWSEREYYLRLIMWEDYIGAFNNYLLGHGLELNGMKIR